MNASLMNVRGNLKGLLKLSLPYDYLNIINAYHFILVRVIKLISSVVAVIENIFDFPFLQRGT